MPFLCSICGEESTRICARCTKDACNNHICEKCLRCSDCCECEVALSEQPPSARSVLSKHESVTAPPSEPAPEPVPESPVSPEPDGAAADRSGVEYSGSEASGDSPAGTPAEREDERGASPATGAPPPVVPD